MAKQFLQPKNGHQISNRKKALAYVAEHLEGLTVLDESTVRFPPHGDCRFGAYTHDQGAMISTPYRDDNTFGSVDWHHLQRIMMFRDFGDGRCVVYVCPIKPLFEKRTIGHHGVTWENILRLSEFTHVFRPD